MGFIIFIAGFFAGWIAGAVVFVIAVANRIIAVRERYHAKKAPRRDN